MVLTSFKFI